MVGKNFRQFRRDDNSAIGLRWVSGEIVLMIGLRRIERRCIFDLCDDSCSATITRSFSAATQALSELLLRFRLTENHRAILRTDVVPLTIQRRWVVRREKQSSSAT